MSVFARQKPPRSNCALRTAQQNSMMIFQCRDPSLDRIHLRSTSLNLRIMPIKGITPVVRLGVIES
jgi:hypothetical protein